MPYVLFVYDRPDRLAAESEEARQAIFAEYQALQALPGVVGYRRNAATIPITVPLPGGKPAADHEPSEHDLPLAGFYLLDTHDRDQAIEIAERIPATRLGGAVEIHALIGE